MKKVISFIKNNIIELAIIVVGVFIATIGMIIVLNNNDSTCKVEPQNETSVVAKPELIISIDNKNKVYENAIKEINYYDIATIKDELFIVVIVKENCPSCERFKNNLENFVNDYDIPVYLSRFEELKEEDKKTFLYVPAYEFYKQNIKFYSDFGNVSSENLYKTFKNKLEEN